MSSIKRKCNKSQSIPKRHKTVFHGSKQYLGIYNFIVVGIMGYLTKRDMKTLFTVSTKLRTLTAKHSKMYGLVWDAKYMTLLNSVYEMTISLKMFDIHNIINYNVFCNHPNELSAIANYIPLNNITRIRMGHHFNDVLTRNMLPNKLENITFGICFNRVIKPNTFPSSLRSITFGYIFNQPLTEDVLPKCLRILTFGYSYNQPIMDGVLPKGLRSLTLGYNYNHPTPIHHHNLKYLRLGNNVVK